MHSLARRLIGLVLAAVGLLCGSGTAHAAVTEISNGFYTISAPGKYVVTRDLWGSGYWGVLINADDVSLDLNGHQICCAPYGVFVVGGKKNIRVTNGTLNGCDFGVCFIDNTKVQVDHVKCVSDIWGIWANTNDGVFGNNEIINMRSIGIAANGDRNRISGNKISSEGDGIAATGAGNQITNNEVSVLDEAVRVDGSRNLVSGNALKGHTAGLLLQGQGNLVVGNHAYESKSGIHFLASATDNRALGNDATTNGTDLVDDAAASCPNTWRGNRFVTDSEGDGPKGGCIR